MGSGSRQVNREPGTKPGSTLFPLFFNKPLAHEIHGEGFTLPIGAGVSGLVQPESTASAHTPRGSHHRPQQKEGLCPADLRTHTTSLPPSFNRNGGAGIEPNNLLTETRAHANHRAQEGAQLPRQHRSPFGNLACQT